MRVTPILVAHSLVTNTVELCEKGIPKERGRDGVHGVRIKARSRYRRLTWYGLSTPRTRGYQ
jgi:hypothetical protein